MRKTKGLPPVIEAFDGSNYPPEEDPLVAEMERLRGLSEKEMFEEARQGTIRLLLAKINTGTITSADLAVLRSILKDNGMILGMDDPEGDRGGQGGKDFQLPHLDDDQDD